MRPDCDIAIIGAGPAGSVIAKFLHDAGMAVTVLEAETFPRFVIGESLLPNCMNVLERAGLLDAVTDAGFQFKNGAVFECGAQYMSIDFRQNFEPSACWGTTFQVKRARFDQILAGETARAGVDIRFGHRVTSANLADGDCRLGFTDENGNPGELRAGFVVDASGYGRVLPRMLGLARPGKSIERRALFTHMRDHITDPGYDREKILITVHPTRHEIWYWLIPFSDGTASVGAIYPDNDPAFVGMADQDIFNKLINDTRLGSLLANAEPIRDLNSIAGYSAQSEKLFGDGYVLLGNSAGFLDPVFSSGVTIAMHSAELAAKALIARHNGNAVDWNMDFAEPLSKGVDTFRAYVDAWYDGRLQTIIFNQPDDDSQLKRMVVSILAGYAWNMENPLVAKTERYLEMLHDLCAPSS
ncbi:NAD(P)/FAD-dependent oxidoreductase [Thalassospira sp.]|uniref:NAD(P)/FAD-dependent oxidoreductase n=1 Tax=Thalassospira sp. TaxID=1912094 RepID=UPI00260EA6C3|nr:NAD(P)/FAD-dependent oxidoreductase [Thalassospira sp.]MCH2276627.1 tryptophan 7-halogenase [Thalassospira sp.]